MRAENIWLRNRPNACVYLDPTQQFTKFDLETSGISRFFIVCKNAKSRPLLFKRISNYRLLCDQQFFRSFAGLKSQMFDESLWKNDSKRYILWNTCHIEFISRSYPLDIRETKRREGSFSSWKMYVIWLPTLTDGHQENTQIILPPRIFSIVVKKNELWAKLILLHHSSPFYLSHSTYILSSEEVSISWTPTLHPHHTL